MDTITNDNLRAVLARIEDMTGAKFDLGAWRPGDGHAYYRIEQGGNRPFGSRYWIGKREAYWGMQSIAAALEYAQAQAVRPCR